MLLSKWSRAYPSRRRFFLAPDDGAGAGAGGAAAAATDNAQAGSEPATRGTAIDETDLELYDGGELLRGATIPEAKREKELPAMWTEENANGEDDEEETAADAAEPEAKAKADADAKAKLDAEAAKGKTEGEEPTAEEVGKWPESAQKRVDALTKKRHEAERERDELKAKVSELEVRASAPPVTPTAADPSNPIARVTDERELAWHGQVAEDARDWALDHLSEGGEVPVSLAMALTGRKAEDLAEKPLVLDVEAVKILRRNSERMLNRHLPAQQKAIESQRGLAAGDAQAKKYLETHYPKFLEPNSEEGRLLTKYEAEFPEIKRVPNWRIALADFVRGSLARIAEETARANPKKETPAKTDDIPLAPVPPGAGRSTGTSARPSVARPRKTMELSASMDADELAAAM